MLSRVFVFAALLVLVASQCSLEGNTYSMTMSGGPMMSVTYGRMVGTWIPAIFNPGDVGNVQFMTVTQQTDSRWEMQSVGTTNVNAYECTDVGQYMLQFSFDCSTITWNPIQDTCDQRYHGLKGIVWSLVDVANVPITQDNYCISAGLVANTRLQPSDLFPLFSGESAQFTFGYDRFAINSVGNVAAVFQQWHGFPPDDSTGTPPLLGFVDLLSFPSGLGCPPASIGYYSFNGFADPSTCMGNLCYYSDTCAPRTQLVNGVMVNGYTQNLCNALPASVTAPSSCSPDGRQWLKHPSICTDQQVDGGCFFCKGIARGEIVSMCLAREGEGCNQVFASPVGMTFCNMEFECPASSLRGASIFVFIATILALCFV